MNNIWKPLLLSGLGILAVLQMMMGQTNAQTPKGLEAYRSREELFDRIYGALVGSAMGDALGAPVEMWGREQIRMEYGWINSMEVVFREASAEGPWNAAPGGTTDDTRWKNLTIQYLTQKNKSGFLYSNALDAKQFAAYIVSQYQQEIKNLKATEGFEPEPYEDNARRMAWLQEWAVIAQPYAEGNWEAYNDKLHRFYGGDLACGGMLYAPAIGMFYPGDPAGAYDEAYKLALFDLGYARDITGLTATLVAAALQADRDSTLLWRSIRDIDPKGFFKSRLLGRITYGQYRQALYISHTARQMTLEQGREKGWTPPAGYRGDTLLYYQMQRAFEMLDEANQTVPFHAGEIHLINLTALLFSQLDTRIALEFVTNYGRDNDTVGAITGAILGAYHGFKALPEDWVQAVLETNKKEMGFDLEALAQQLTETVWSRKKRP